MNSTSGSPRVIYEGRGASDVVVQGVCYGRFVAVADIPPPHVLEQLDSKGLGLRGADEYPE
jgi:hypothetical protein